MSNQSVLSICDNCLDDKEQTSSFLIDQDNPESEVSYCDKCREEYFRVTKSRETHRRKNLQKVKSAVEGVVKTFEKNI